MAKKDKEKKVQQEVSPEEEQKKLDQSLQLTELNNPETLESFSEKVESSRQDFFKTYNSQKRLSNILIPVVGVLMAASLILFIGVAEQWGKILGGVIIGVTLVGMIVYFFTTKNKLPNKSRDYISNFVTLSDNYVFADAEYKNAKVFISKRFATADLLPDRVYKDVVDIASRNIVEFEYKDHNIQIGELALYKQGAKRNQKGLLYVGKYMSFQNDYHFEDRYIISIRGKDEVDIPNDIEDLVILKEQNKFVVYGKEGSNVEKDLGKGLLNDLLSIECHASLLNVNIVLWAGHTAVYMSYDDSIVAIPLDKKLNAASYQQLKKNIKDLLTILINK